MIPLFLKRLLVGPPLATSRLIHERVTKFKGLAVFSSDAATLLAPVATFGLLLVGALVVLVIALTHAWPALVAELLGMAALLLTAALFFLLLLRALFAQF
ncbi:MAG: hypothetical protein QN120_08645 [Armatimonadota bacterium]|nr:hypothetical protein [Armatimonadota bacterium]